MTAFTSLTHSIPEGMIIETSSFTIWESVLEYVSKLKDGRERNLVCNVASIQILKKNGFVHEGTLKRAVIKNGVIYDLCIFGLIK